MQALLNMRWYRFGSRFLVQKIGTPFHYEDQYQALHWNRPSTSTKTYSKTFAEENQHHWLKTLLGNHTALC